MKHKPNLNVKRDSREDLPDIEYPLVEEARPVHKWLVSIYHPTDYVIHATTAKEAKAKLNQILIDESCGFVGNRSPRVEEYQAEILDPDLAEEIFGNPEPPEYQSPEY